MLVRDLPFPEHVLDTVVNDEREPLDNLEDDKTQLPYLRNVLQFHNEILNKTFDHIGYLSKVELDYYIKHCTNNPETEYNVVESLLAA